jgi:hypothetical protein
LAQQRLCAEHSKLVTSMLERLQPIVAVPVVTLAHCYLLCCAACRFVEALLQAGRPATALAVQRARCAGGSSGSSSLNEAEVLLRVQLGCGLLAEAFCDLRRHCNEVRGSGKDGGAVTQ